VKIHSSVGKIIRIEFESELEFNANNDLCLWVICENLTLKCDDIFLHEKLFLCTNSNGKRLYLPCSYIENTYSTTFICNIKWKKINGWGLFLKNKESYFDHDGVFFHDNSQYSVYSVDCGSYVYCLTEEPEDFSSEFTYQSCYG
jgi:hypothetical protein